MLLDGLKSVDVPGTLGVEVSHHGSHATQEHAKEDGYTKQHSSNREPFFTKIWGVYIAVSCGGRSSRSPVEGDNVGIYRFSQSQIESCYKDKIFDNSDMPFTQVSITKAVSGSIY